MIIYKYSYIYYKYYFNLVFTNNKTVLIISDLVIAYKIIEGVYFDNNYNICQSVFILMKKILNNNVGSLFTN